MAGITAWPHANVGAVLSEGFDGHFAFKHRLNKVFLTVRGNFTYSKNTIQEKDEEYHVYPYKMEKGYRVNQARGLVSLGLFKDYDDIRNSPTQTFGTVQPGDIKYKDVNGDGIIDANDEVPIGATTRPNLMYGFGISANWKGLDVNVHFQGTGKSSFFVEGATVYAFSQGEWGNILSQVASSDRWVSADISGDPATENPNAKYPRLYYGGSANNDRNSTFWLSDGGYLRLKNIQVSYTARGAFLKKLGLQKAVFSLIGDNLAVWSKEKMLDPAQAGDNGNAYPIQRVYTLQLNLSF